MRLELRWDPFKILLGSGIIMFFTAGARTSFGLALEEFLLQDLRATPATTTAIYNACLAFWFVSSLVASLLCHYVPCWKLIFVGCTLVPGGLILSSLASEAWVLLFLFSVIVGVGTGFCTTPAFLIVSKRFPNHRGSALGLYGLSATLGSMTMPFVQATMLQDLPPRQAVLLCGGLALHLLCGAMLLHTVRISFQTQQTEETTKKKSCCDRFSEYFKLSEVSDVRIIALIVADALFWVTHSNFNYLLPIYVQQGTADTRVRAASLMTFSTGILLLGQLSLPILADKRILKSGHGYLCGLVSLTFGLAGFPLVKGEMQRLWGFICCAGVGIGAAGCRAFYPIFLIDTFGLGRLPSIHGYVTLAKGVFVMILAYVFGYSRKNAHGDALDDCFYALGGFVCVASVVWIVLLFNFCRSSENRE